MQNMGDFFYSEPLERKAKKEMCGAVGRTPCHRIHLPLAPAGEHNTVVIYSWGSKSKKMRRKGPQGWTPGKEELQEAQYRGHPRCFFREEGSRLM